MLTTLTIAGQAYDGGGGPSGWANKRIRIDGLTRNWGGPADSFEFNADSCGPFPPFIPGVEVRVTVSNDDGSNPVLRFVGDVGRAQSRHGDGWNHAYSCDGLKARGDRVTITGADGSGTARYNLAPLDPMYVPSQAGRNVGQIATSVLQVPATVAQLRAMGIGNYALSGTPPTYKLPASTLADLAALTLVPQRPVTLAGQGLFNILEDFIAEFHPRFGLWVDPDGTIRCKDLFALQQRTVTLPSDISLGDDPAADGLAINLDAAECYGAVNIVGTDVALFVASLKYNGLAPHWSAIDEKGGGPDNLPPWNITNYTTPGDSAAQGTASNVTANSFTAQCDDPKQKWAAGYWQSVGGRAYLLNSTILPGVLNFDSRVITDSAALTPGGTATITLDPTQPLETNQYDRFIIRGLASPRALVGRDYSVVGCPFPLYPMFPRPEWWSHMGNLDQVSTPRGVVQWSANRDGKAPFFEAPVAVQVDPENKRIRLAQPAAQLSAPDVVPFRYPVSEADGAPHDVQVALPCFRGALGAYAPAGGGFRGLGFTKLGLTRVRTLAIPGFTDRSQADGYAKMAEERLQVYQDPAISASVRHIDYPTAFDPLATAYALKFDVPGATTPIDGIAVPCRSVRVEWDGPTHSVSYSCSNNRRPSGDDQYVHPSYAPSLGGAGLGYGDSFSAGIDTRDAIGNFGSTVESTAARAGLPDPAAMPAPVSIDPILQPIVGAGPAGDFGGFGDFGSAGDFGDAGTSPGGRRKDPRQRRIDDTAKAGRALRSPAENAEKKRLADAILHPAPEPKPEAAMPEPPVGSSMTEFLLGEQAKRHHAPPKMEGTPGLRPRASDDPEVVRARSTPTGESVDPAKQLVDDARPPADDKPLTLRERRRRGIADRPEEES